VSSVFLKDCDVPEARGPGKGWRGYNGFSKLPANSSLIRGVFSGGVIFKGLYLGVRNSGSPSCALRAFVSDRLKHQNVAADSRMSNYFNEFAAQVKNS
jgi:hypothetical protein